MRLTIRIMNIKSIIRGKVHIDFISSHLIFPSDLPIGRD